MKLRRREILRLGAGVAAASWPPAASLAQSTLPDAPTDSPGTEYFFLGNGRLLAAVQSVVRPESGTHGGIVLLSSNHFGRKTGSFLFGESSGLRRSLVLITVAGRSYAPEAGQAPVRWEYPDGIPTVRIEWTAGPCIITENLYVPYDASALVRTVTVRNQSAAPVEAALSVSLRPNSLFFDDYDVDRGRATLTAAGYHRLQLFALETAEAGDRDLRIPLGSMAPRAEVSRTVVLALDVLREELEAKGFPALRAATNRYWNAAATLSTGDAGLDHLFRVAQSGLRAAVARSGKMDGGMLQYNLEWVRDAVMVACGGVMAGLPDVGHAILDRVLSRSVDDDGRTLDSGRHRPVETIELDQNGELLHALWTHWAWTGDDSLIRTHWKRVRAVADYVLQPVFRDPSIGLVRNSRELWERGPQHGVKDGYELSYQAFNVVGLARAAEMAAQMGDQDARRRWQDAGLLMHEAMLRHLVEDGRFIKRRLPDGTVQNTFEPPDRRVFPPGMPLAFEKVSYCDPDAANALPIALGLVEGTSDLARNTLASLEKLWNQRWEIGGYGRYDVTSEPDSPGPWPFATLFIARAYLEAGDSEKVWRALRWFQSVQGGRSGGWFEFYGRRPVPPLSPVGFIPWTWAEMVTLFVHHMLGFRPSPGGLTVRPQLLAGLPRAEARLLMNGVPVHLAISRATGAPAALVDRRPVPLQAGVLELPRPTRELRIDLRV